MIRRHFRFFLLIILILWLVNLHHRRNKPSRPAHVEAYVQQFGPVARELGQETGVPPAIILGLASLESGFGQSKLAREGNNHIGKKASRGQPTYCLPTYEYSGKKRYTVKACFRAYDSPDDSLRDLAMLLSTAPRYQELFNYSRSDIEAWADGLKRCGYATDPAYAKKLVKVIRLYHLDRI